MKVIIVRKRIIVLYAALCILMNLNHISAQNPQNCSVSAEVNFAVTLQEWDGFGVNYVELAQSTDPVTDPQDYGGFNRLTEEKRQEIIDMIFGENGLRPNIVKMFLDPFQQKESGDAFDHESTTKWMRYFAREGLKKTAARGEELEIITTLYGPPAWATKQKFLRGRDLDPEQYENLATYMIDWTKFLLEKEKLPIKYLSLHNEGDSPERWPLDGSHGNIGTGNDYNAFWRPWEVAHFLDFMPPLIKTAGLDVGMTPGECTSWSRFSDHWYHWAIQDNENAMKNLALITSHGFGEGRAINSKASDLLRMKRPDLHAWTTSMTWGNKKTSDFEFVDLIRRNIYDAKVNAVIPWAALQTNTWMGGDPNPGTAFFISGEGKYEIRPQYYYYKQLCRVGQRGMKVASVKTEEGSGIELIAFSSNGTNNPDAFLVLNLTDNDKEVIIEIDGTNATEFIATRSGKTEKYKGIGEFSLSNGKLTYKVPAGSLSTFIAK